MNLPISILMVLASVFLLWFGAEWLVKGASKLALSMNIKPIIIGLTVVAFGTSAPELVVSVSAGLGGTPDMALANVIGSNIANIALVLGICALINPIEIQKDTMKNDIPFLVLVSFLTYVLGRYGYTAGTGSAVGFNRVDGIIMLGFLFYFLIRIFLKTKGSKEVDPELKEILEEKRTSFWKCFLLVLIGALFLVAGGQCLVEGGKFIAERIGIPAYFIGLTMVALGTSLPELAASGMAAYRNETDLCMGNIIGSNIMNLILVLAVTIVIAPIAVTSNIVNFQLPGMIAIVILLYFLCRIGKMKISKVEGVILLLVYFSFIGYSYLNKGPADSPPGSSLETNK